MEAECQRYQQLFEFAPEGYLVTDADGIMLEANPAAAALLRKAPEQLVGVALADFICLAERQRFGAWLHELMQNRPGQPARAEWDTLLQPADAALLPVACTVSAIRHPAPDAAELFWFLRKRAHPASGQAALPDSQAFNQAVLDSLASNVAVLDQEGAIMAVNSAWMRFAQQNGDPPPAQIGVGANYVDVCRRVQGADAEVATAVANGIQAVLDGRISRFSLEYPCPSPDHARWFLLNVVPLLDSTQGAVTTHLDITRRKQMEEDLRHERDFAESLIETAQAIILVLDPQGRVARFNSYMAQLSGYRLAEVQGADWFATFVPPLEREPMRARFEQAISGTPTRGRVNTMQTRDGGEVAVEWHDKVLRDANGATLGLLVIGQDVTQRRRAEQALHESEARNRTLLAAIPDSIVRVNRDGTYLDVKAPMDFTPIVPVEQMVGQNVRNIVPPALATRFLEQIERAVQTEQLQTFEYEIQIGEELRTREARVMPDGDNEVILILRDVTERHRAQAEAVRLLDEVHAQRVQLRALNQRLGEIQEDERRELARELHDQVGQNLSTLGINLNIIQTQVRAALPDVTPIHALLADSQWLLKQTIERVRNVLTELRPPMLDDYGLTATLAWYADHVSHLADLTLTVELEEILPRLSAGAENALFRIVQEAMTNIVKHAGATQVAIRLTAGRDAITLTVTDNGCGFNPQRLASSAPRQSWGLLTMRERAEAVGGQFEIESGSGHGTSIRIVLPR